MTKIQCITDPSILEAELRLLPFLKSLLESIKYYFELVFKLSGASEVIIVYCQQKSYQYIANRVSYPTENKNLTITSVATKMLT